MDPIGIGAIPSYYMAAFAEGICAILVVAGLFSRFATLILSINFLVVVGFHASSGDGFDMLELPIIYLAAFVAFTLTGPGNISLDNKLFKRKTSFY